MSEFRLFENPPIVFESIFSLNVCLKTIFGSREQRDKDKGEVDTGYDDERSLILGNHYQFRQFETRL